MRVPFSRAVSLAVLLSAASVAADPLHPSADDKAAARSAAGKGNTAFAERRFADALDLFTRAEAVVHAPTHVLMIARSNVALGHLVAAQEEYRDITRDPLGKTGPPAFAEAVKSAQTELVDVEARVPSVRVTTTPAGAKGLQVKVDDGPMQAALVGIERPIDPGKHTFEAIADGLRSDKRVVTIAERDHSTVEIALSPAPNAPISSDPAAGPPTDASDGTTAKGSLRPFAFAAIGVGVAGLAVGTVFSILATWKRGDANNLYATCPCSPNSERAQEILADDQVANTRRTIAAASLIGGGVLTAAGLAYVIFTPRATPASTSATTRFTVHPLIGKESLGIAGSF